MSGINRGDIMITTRIVKQIIKSLNEKFELQTVTLNLPRNITSLLRQCEEDGIITLNDFIVDSTRGYIAFSNSLVENAVLRRKSTQIEVITLKFPRMVCRQLAVISRALKVDKSDLVYTALAHSIPPMLEENQIFEDYAVEEALNVARGNN